MLCVRYRQWYASHVCRLHLPEVTTKLLMSDHEYGHTQQHGIDYFSHQYVHEVMSQELHAQRGKPDRPFAGGKGSVQQQTNM